MAWTAPRTWVAGEKPTAATMNLHIRDNLNWLYAGSGWVTVPAIAPFTIGDLAVRRIGAMVVLRGYVSRGSGWTNATLANAATVPAGYRPTVDHYFAPGQPSAAAGFGVRGVVAASSGILQIGMEAASTGGMGCATTWFID